MTWTFDIQPLVPLWLAIALAAIAGVLVLLALFGGVRGAVLRALAGVALAAALFNPVLLREEREMLPDIAVVVADRSQSQLTGSRTELTDAALAELRTRINALPDTEIRLVDVRSGITTSDEGTHAFAALRQALSDVPPERYAGAVMITDGQIHDIPGSEIAAGYDGPLHALVTGKPGELDRTVKLTQSPKFGIVGERQPMRFIVQDAGAEQGRPVLVTIAIDGQVLGTVTTTTGTETEMEIEITHGGDNIIELSAAELPGELTTRNNRAIVVTKGIRDRLRVLLISGKPHPGERTWRNLLKADTSVDLVHFTILRPPEKQDGTPINELSLIAFPTRELFVEKLDEFDLIIFDRYERRGVLPVTYLANIADYVEKGGAVLVAAGPGYAGPTSLYRTPLSAVLPAMPTGNVTVKPFKALVTQKGERHPVVRGLPGSAGDNEPSWGRWFRIIDSEVRDGDIVMADPDDRPLMILSRVGEGRVAQLMSDHAWLWARGFEGGGPQAEALRRMAHWLMKEPQLEEEALTGTQTGNTLTIQRNTMQDETADVTVTMPSGKTETVKLEQARPGIWRGQLEATEAGLHRLSDGKLDAVAAIGTADPRETTDLIATTSLLATLAEQTRAAAQFVSADGTSATLAMPRLAKVGPGRAMAGSGWIGLKANGAYRVLSIGNFPLFSTLLALAALLGLMSLTWYREGR
jgi:hypothetical protein